MFGIKSINKLAIATAFIAFAFTQTVSLQGVLRDPLGRTVNDGEYQLTFRIYDMDVGGEALWEETYEDMQITHGVFAVELGSINSMSGLTFGVQYYVGVSVQGSMEMEPRLRLTNAPAAMAVFGVDNIFPSSGNIGVGTTEPDAGLHIKPAANAAGDQDLLTIENDSGASVRVDANSDMHFTGAIYFSDGSILNTAQGGSAAALSAPNGSIIEMDNNNDGDGDLIIQRGGAIVATVSGFGDGSFNGNLSADGNASVGGDATITGDLSADDLIVAGTITAGGDVAVDDLSAAGTVSATNITAENFGDVSANSVITTGDVEVGGGLTVTGDIHGTNTKRQGLDVIWQDDTPEDNLFYNLTEGVYYETGTTWESVKSTYSAIIVTFITDNNNNTFYLPTDDLYLGQNVMWEVGKYYDKVIILTISNLTPDYSLFSVSTTGGLDVQSIIFRGIR